MLRSRVARLRVAGAVAVLLALGGLASCTDPRGGQGNRVVVYGATSAGITAAVAAVRRGAQVTLLDPGSHVGGMTTGGLGATDCGNTDAIGGLAAELYAQVGTLYDDPSQSYFFEPHVARRAFEIILEKAGVQVRGESRIVEVTKHDGALTSVATADGSTFAADVFVDATYEGDLMALAGVSYTVGRESSDTYGEPLNGVTVTSSPDSVFVDPYVVPGEPSSGLIRSVSPGPPAPRGSADRHVQAYNFRLCLTRAPDRVPFSLPADYDPDDFELLARWIEAIAARQAPVFADFVMARPLPNGKFDANASQFFSTDLAGGSDAYPEADPAARAKIRARHESYIRGYLYFLATSPRVPQSLRDEASSYGLCADEFTESGGWPPQLYVREARRMVGTYVMTQHDILREASVPDSVGLGSFYMDSHYTQRLAVRGTTQVEGVFLGDVPTPYPISYGSLVPRREEATNLLVPVCLSASHVAYGSLRMEPVYMILGHSAGVAAALAAAGHVAVQDVPYSQLEAALLAEGQILTWPQ